MYFRTYTSSDRWCKHLNQIYFFFYFLLLKTICSRWCLKLRWMRIKENRRFALFIRTFGFFLLGIILLTLIYIKCKEISFINLKWFFFRRDFVLNYHEVYFSFHWLCTWVLFFLLYLWLGKLQIFAHVYLNFKLLLLLLFYKLHRSRAWIDSHCMCMCAQWIGITRRWTRKKVYRMKKIIIWVIHIKRKSFHACYYIYYDHINNYSLQ